VTPRRLALALALAALFFALGLWIGRRDPATKNAAEPAPSILVTDGGVPRLVFDPSSIDLLPDASLKLDPIAPPGSASASAP
jgi:hypothetical protein